MGHNNEDAACAAANALGWEIARGSMKPVKHIEMENQIKRSWD